MKNNIAYGFEELCDIENRYYNMRITPPAQFLENSKELSLIEAELYRDKSKIDKLREPEYMGAIALLLAHLPIALYFYLFFEKLFNLPALFAVPAIIVCVFLFFIAASSWNDISRWNSIAFLCNMLFFFVSSLMFGWSKISVAFFIMSAVCGFCFCCAVFVITFCARRRISIRYNQKIERATELTSYLGKAKDVIQQEFEKEIENWNNEYAASNGQVVTTPKLCWWWEEYSDKLSDLLKKDHDIVDNTKTVNEKIMDVTFNSTEEFIPTYNTKKSTVSHMVKIIEEYGCSLVPYMHGVRLQDICSASEEYQISFYEVNVKHKWSYSSSREVTTTPSDDEVARYDAKKDLWERVESSRGMTNEEMYAAGHMDSDTAAQKQFTRELNRDAYINSRTAIGSEITAMDNGEDFNYYPLGFSVLTNESAPHLTAIIYIRNKNVGDTVLLSQILKENPNIHSDVYLPTPKLVNNMNQALMVYTLTAFD